MRSALSTVRTLVPLALLAVTGLAHATPTVLTLGAGQPSDLSSDGSVVVGNGSGGTYRWVRTASPRLMVIGGSSGANASVSGDGSFVAAQILNTERAGEQPTNLPITGRWSSATGQWENIGVFDTYGGNCSGTINNAYDMSSDGRFVVGLGYELGCGLARGFIWDAATGSMKLLETSDPMPDGFTSTRANAVSADGSVVVGFDQRNARVPAVWVRDPETGEYPASTILDPDFGELYDVNAAGTVLVGEAEAFRGQPVTWTSDGAGGWTATPLPAMARPAWVPEDAILQTMRATAISDDGSVVVGSYSYRALPFTTYSGGFIWTAASGETKELYGYLASRSAAGLEAFAPTSPGGAPRLAAPRAISGDGNAIIGGGGLGATAYVVYLDGVGCTPLQVSLQPNPVGLSRCTSTAIFNTGVSGSIEGLAYQWRRNGVALTDGATGNGSTVSGATTAQLRFTSAKAADAGQIDCVITNACGSVPTDAVPLSVLEIAANDTCSGALPVGAGSHPFNMCATLAANDTAGGSCGVGTSSDLWFRYTPAFQGTVRFATCGSSFDTVLSIYDACDGFEGFCDDSGCTTNSTASTRSAIDNYFVTAGTPYYLRLSKKGSSTSIGDTGVLEITVLNGGCSADFDNANGVQVADIFAFLRAWFANAPSADFDGQNGIQVADIFAFLRAWFAGC